MVYSLDFLMMIRYYYGALINYVFKLLRGSKSLGTSVLIIITVIVTILSIFLHGSDSISFNSQSSKYMQLSNHVANKYVLTSRYNILNGSKLSSFTYNQNVLNEYKLAIQEQSQSNTILQRENATLLMLVRNWELPEALKSMRSLEDRFNRKYHYDWVFMNDVPFTEQFIEATTAMASGNAYHVLIPSEDWDCPNHINHDLFEKRIDIMSSSGILYGQSKSYRNMCRFNSGYFFRQEILLNYDYYFRVEPNVEYFCDFPYDPFKLLRQNGKKYGFVISLREYEQTIPTLWESVEEYINLDDGATIDMTQNAYDFIVGDDIVGNDKSVYVTTHDYNLCHFWSNFEIGDLNFFRSDAYLKFFNHLDSKGGFYYERWGDAPVHSIAASLLLNKDEIIHFAEV